MGLGRRAERGLHGGHTLGLEIVGADVSQWGLQNVVHRVVDSAI